MSRLSWPIGFLAVELYIAGTLSKMHTCVARVYVQLLKNRRLTRWEECKELGNQDTKKPGNQETKKPKTKKPGHQGTNKQGN